MKYVCTVCGYVYDENVGIPEIGIAPGTKWEDVPEDFNCPWCGADKSLFEPMEEETKKETVILKEPNHESAVEREMSAMEMSVLCSNLARGCEKQYLMDESKDFAELSKFFSSQAEHDVSEGFEDLLKLIEHDLNVALPYASQVSKEQNDRGAQRAIAWSTKVTSMLKSLVERYLKMGDAMLENTGVFVCTACGFIFIGDKAPEVCPVCKVPSWKFEEVK